MQICPSYDHERKDIKDWDVFDYLNALHNEADRYEYDGKQDIANAFNSFARSLLKKETSDYDKRYMKVKDDIKRTLSGD